MQKITYEEFGISDEQGGEGMPAKVIEQPNEERETEQFASDNEGENLIKRCEGFLLYQLEEKSSIRFVEIKNNRTSRGGWIKDAREKFEETILSFKEHHANCGMEIEKPILCNPGFGGLHASDMVQKRVLKDKVGVEFIRTKKIEL
ncbi:MAG: hypothetical protein ACRC3Z_11350 [Phocaeicola sp.]